MSSDAAPRATTDRDDIGTPPAPAAWTATFDGGPDLTFQPLDLDRHLELVHGWMHQAHVAPWWQLDGDLDEVAAYLDGQLHLDHLQPWIVQADGSSFGYVETYRADRDPLAPAVVASDLDVVLDDGDRGWHVLVGPPEAVGSGLGRLLGRAVLASAFADPGVRRVVCEPDERNLRMIRYCVALGHVDLGRLPFGEKTAALLACPRPSSSVPTPLDGAITTGAST